MTPLKLVVEIIKLVNLQNVASNGKQEMVYSVCHITLSNKKKRTVVTYYYTAH